MNTPTDDEIVAHIAALADWPNAKPTDVELMKAVAREVLRLAREGLPKPVDEATLLVREVMHTYQDAKPETRPDGGNMRWRKGSYDNLESTVAAIEAARTFLAARDAERDAEIAELVKAASYARICLKNGGYHNEWTRNLDAVLAKLERKP